MISFYPLLQSDFLKTRTSLCFPDPRSNPESHTALSCHHFSLLEELFSPYLSWAWHFWKLQATYFVEWSSIWVYLIFFFLFRFRLRIFWQKITDVCPAQCIISRGTWCHFCPITSDISFDHLPSFSIVKMLCFPLLTSFL